tara:strand:+ start:94 stop:273 length:180 start_codon:yes stop_codon:yes gene_type:complete
MCKPKIERTHIMNPTTKKLKKLLKNSTSFPPDHPIYSEPPGILFTGKTRKPKRKEENYE